MCWYYLDSFPLELLLGFLYFSTTTKKHQLLDQTLFFSTKFSTSKLQMKNYFVSTWLNQHLKETGNNTIFLLSPGGKKIAAHDKRVGCNTVTQGQLKILYLDSTRFLLGYITRLAFRPVAVKKNLGSCSISFLVHPGRSPGMISLCLSASRIYNTFSISTRSRKKKN